MTGKIIGISGPTVRTDMKGLKLYERVYVGHDMLTGEVVRLEEDSSVIQVYEDTKGLGVWEPVKGVGKPFTVRLGPGLLAGMFDGLQRPLERLRDEMGPFIVSGKEIYALDYMHTWQFAPLMKTGDKAYPGDALGYVKEGPFKHYLLCPPGTEGTISTLISGGFSLDDVVGTLDDGRELFGCNEWPVRVPRPYRKKIVPSQPLVTGQRIIDFMFPIAQGGTAIMPGGFGTGKTILEQSIAKYADVDLVIYVGCGERGNEMADLIGELASLSDPWTERPLMERTILTVNTSNMPVAAREASIYTAVTMGEYFRDMGYNVLLLADSISRWAEALREISSSLEEMPGEEGYPTYLASRISGFMERAGVVETLNGQRGSLSMILSVSPPGGDFTEPVTQACLRVAGAFHMLDTALAHRRHFPAINWSQSYSLYGRELSEHFKESVSQQWDELQKTCKTLLQKEESLKDVAEIVGIEGLQDSDRLIMKVAEMIRLDFFCQNAYTEDAFSPPQKTVLRMKTILNCYERSTDELKKGKPIDDVLKDVENTPEVKA
jgi:V/A-type H+-transporting ATPase subunit A